MDEAMSPLTDQTFFQFSDLHLPERVGDGVCGFDPIAQLRRVIAAAKATDARPTCVIVSGDLSDNGSVGSYQTLQTVLPELESFGVPVLLGLGNHDRRVSFRGVILGEADPAEDAAYYYKRVIGDLHVFMLDSKTPGKVAGELGPKQRAWLAAELEQTPRGQALIVLHHSTTLWGIPNIEEDELADARDLAEILTPHAVLGVLGGHLHFSVVAAYAGSVALTAPAVANRWDATCSGPRMMGETGFNLCTVRGGRLLVNPILLGAAG